VEKKADKNIDDIYKIVRAN